LYPLFVHNIGGLLYHPTNQNRTNAVVAASERRRLEGSQGQHPRTTPGSQPPALTHHHTMSNPIGAHIPQPPHSIAPHPGAGRPGIDRAHTFPTPPTSASSTMGLGSQGNSYEWGGGSISGGMPNTQTLSIDTGLSNTRSMPTTPATTPPGNSMQNMQSYQNQPNYDNKSYYSAPPPAQTQYASHHNIAQQNMARFGPPIQSNQYVKNEMGPPSRTGTVTEADHHDPKPESYHHSQGNGQVGHGPGDGEADHEHEPDYIHDNNAAYNASRGPYSYSGNPAVGSLAGEHPHLSPEMTGSPSHQNGSGRGTPRNTATAQQWTQGYNTPPRAPPSSNLYNVMSDPRGSGPNGSVTDPYSSAAPGGGYPSTINGAPTSNKRMREDDDQDQRPESRGADSTFDLKRRKTAREGSVGGPVGSLATMKAGAIPRRR
jgi:protein SOK2